MSQIDAPQAKNNFLWRDNKNKYTKVHRWVSKILGRDSFCESCGTEEDRRYEWANISGEYKEEVEDWLRMCVPCHRKFDMTDEWKHNMSIVRKGRILGYQRTVTQYNLKGDIVSTYPSVANASRMTGIVRTAISNALIGLSKTAGGYSWI